MLGGRAEAEAGIRRLLRSRYGARRAVLTDSGTSALTLALRSVRAIGRSRVAFPGFSCYDLGTAWQGAEVRPLLYDVEPETLGPEPVSLRRSVDDGADALVLAYLYGIPLDWGAIHDTTGEHSPLIIEDAAQASGCSWEGARAGSLGDLSVLSFGRGKGRTGGGGGALLALTERGEEAISDLEAERLEAAGSLFPLLGSLAQWALSHPSVYSLPAKIPGLNLGETVYHRPSPPGGISTFALGMLRETVPLEDDAAEARRIRAERLRKSVQEAHDVIPVECPRGGEPGFLRLPVVARYGAGDRLGGQRAVRLGVMPSYPRPLYRVPELAGDVGERDLPLPGAERLSGALFTLPTHGLLNRSEIRGLAEIIRGGARV